jgi:hypothetical protein
MSRGISEELEKLEYIGGLYGGEDWTWDQLDMYYDPASRIYRWYSGGGCSCDSMSDRYDSMESLDEMEFGRQDEAIRAVKRYVEHEDQETKADGRKLVEGIKSCRGDIEGKFIAEGHRPTLAEGAL